MLIIMKFLVKIIKAPTTTITNKQKKVFYIHDLIQFFSAHEHHLKTMVILVIILFCFCEIRLIYSRPK